MYVISSSIVLSLKIPDDLILINDPVIFARLATYNHTSKKQPPNNSQSTNKLFLRIYAGIYGKNNKKNIYHLKSDKVA